MKNTYLYRIDGDDPRFDSAFESKWNSNEFPDFVAEDAAEEFDNNGNWPDGNAPVRLTIMHLNKYPIETYDIYREYYPTFSAYKVKE